MLHLLSKAFLSRFNTKADPFRQRLFPLGRQPLLSVQFERDGAGAAQEPEHSTLTQHTMHTALKSAHKKKSRIRETPTLSTDADLVGLIQI